METSIRERETWRGKFDFVISFLGYSVGFGNILRFPFLCFKSGGAAFLIPYIILIIVVAFPMLLLEVGLGQFMQSGAITAWNIVPIFQGIGYAATIVVHWFNIYYAVNLALSLHYMFASFTSVLPWSHCNNSWNTDQCVILHGVNSTAHGNSTGLNARDLHDKAVSASHEYWDHKVIQLSAGLEEPGPVNWDVALCLLLAWILCYLCVWRGTRSTGKIVYFTAISPYVIMFVLLIRAVTLDGAREGIGFLVHLDLPKLGQAEVWLDAAKQVLYSYSIGLGTLTTLGSYNKFHFNMYRDCIIFAFANTLTSVFSGIFIFSLLGFLAKEEGVSVDLAAVAGPELAFVAIPAAISRIPVAPLWAFLFCLMLILLGIDSEFVGIQAFVTAVVDWYPNYLRKQYRTEIFTVIICFSWFLIGLPLVAKGGPYAFTLINSFSGGGAMMFILVLFQTIVVAWIYGADIFYEYTTGMNGFRPCGWIMFCWKYSIPLFCLVMFVLSLMVKRDLTFGDHYVFPGWSLAIGWLISLSSLLCIPVVAVMKMIRTEGSLRERWTILTTAQIPEHIREVNKKLKAKNRNKHAVAVGAITRPATSVLVVSNPATGQDAVQFDSVTTLAPTVNDKSYSSH